MNNLMEILTGNKINEVFSLTFVQCWSSFLLTFRTSTQAVRNTVDSDFRSVAGQLAQCTVPKSTDT